MAENKQEKKDLAAGSHISLAVNQRIKKDTQGILNSLTSLSLAKAYYSLFQSGHYDCWCFYCHLQHMILRTIMDRGDHYKYLNGELNLDNFEETDPPDPFYEEWLRKDNLP